ncbi:unnamed protein product [Larinioides sclopetarius]|uniref:Uncharacterized protein n=1 Tax=Larinioides sclopetarius TaxID=280406 RepID=A0AAV2BMV8_9ARAC
MIIHSFILLSLCILSSSQVFDNSTKSDNYTAPFECSNIETAEAVVVFAVTLWSVYVIVFITSVFVKIWRLP